MEWLQAEGKEILRFYSKVHHDVHETQTLSLLNVVNHALENCYQGWVHLNVIVSSTCVSRVVWTFLFPGRNFVFMSHFYVHGSCPTPLTLFDLLSLIIFRKEYKSWTFCKVLGVPLCSLPHMFCLLRRLQITSFRSSDMPGTCLEQVKQWVHIF